MGDGKHIKWNKQQLRDMEMYDTVFAPSKYLDLTSDRKLFKIHDHQPTAILKGKENGGWKLYIGSKYGVAKHATEYDRIINLTGDSLFHPYGHRVPAIYGTELQKYSEGELELAGAEREMLLDWPNYGVPKLQFRFWQELYKHITTVKRTLMFCQGGHGRTGTATALLFLVSGAFTSGKEALEWLRKNYCEEAVEGKGQEELIENFARWLKK